MSAASIDPSSSNRPSDTAVNAAVTVRIAAPGCVGRGCTLRLVGRRVGRLGLLECLEQLLRFALAVVLGPSGRGGVIAGVVDVRVGAVVEQQPDHRRGFRASRPRAAARSASAR